MVICLERGANDLHMVHLMHCHPIISCCIKIHNGLTFLVPTYPDFPGKEAVKWVSVLTRTPPLEVAPTTLATFLADREFSAGGCYLFTVSSSVLLFGRPFVK